MTKKETLLQELRQHTFAILKTSQLHGIGVFAIAQIKKGERKIFSNHPSEWIEVSREEVESLPKHSRDLVENHCLFNESHYYIPEYGFKIFDLAVYLNHSDQPNLISINDGEFFEAIRDIDVGEELLIDYGTIVESEE
jgi:SET domain-containing protein